MVISIYILSEIDAEAEGGRLIKKPNYNLFLKSTWKKQLIVLPN